LEIRDEYDVQDLLHALLLVEFGDIRREEWTPSYAGGSARADLLIKDDEIVIETKFATKSLRDKKLGEQLIVDIARYSKHPDCGALVCFIYDPQHHVENREALRRDLETLGELV